MKSYTGMSRCRRFTRFSTRITALFAAVVLQSMPAGAALRNWTSNDVVLSRLTTPPPPTLTIQGAGPSSVRLLWATNEAPFSLQTLTNLTATNWTAASPLPVVVGTDNVVTNAVSGTRGFYRLSNP
jgi:hypothetical protein